MAQSQIFAHRSSEWGLLRPAHQSRDAPIRGLTVGLAYVILLYTHVTGGPHVANRHHHGH
jgi:hypothetical protein